MTESFVEEFCTESGLKPKRITPAAMKLLRAHSWPGNVRELRNLMERLVIMTPGSAIDAGHLPETVRSTPSERPVSLEDARRVFERDYLTARLREHGGNISRTAEAIGLARESLSRKIKAHAIEIERE